MPGQQVLLLLPLSKNKLQIRWQGPYEILGKVRSVDYEVMIPHKFYTCFIFIY